MSDTSLKLINTHTLTHTFTHTHTLLPLIFTAGLSGHGLAT